MYELINTFAQPERVISRHCTPKAAGKAESAYQRAVKRANGDSSYIPTTIRHSDGSALTEAEVDRLDSWRRP